MQLKQLLVLLFALVALIPASLMTANSAYSIFKLQEQISNLYNGILVIIVGLDDGQFSLLQMKSDVLSHILTTDSEQMELLAERIKQNELHFSDVLADYKEISDFPLQVEIMKRRGLEQMISDDREFITQVRLDWIQYQATRDSLLSLSGQNRNSEAAAVAFGEANTKFDKLISSYQKTVDLNKEIAQVLYEESNHVAGLAYLYSAVSFAASFGIAVIVAVLLSKKMTSPIAEAQRRAKKDLDKFAVESAIISKSDSSIKNNPHSPFSSHPQLESDVAKEGERRKKEEELLVANEDTTSAKLGPYGRGVIEEEQRLFNEILSNNQLILLHVESYYKSNNQGPPSFSSNFLHLLISHVGDGRKKNNNNDQVHSGATTTIANRKLILITRAGSNLHRELSSRREGAEIYLLSLSMQAPITKSADGLVAISLTNTPLIVEAIRRALEGTPSSTTTIIFDNVTELVYTIGFEKALRFIRTLFEIVASFPNARLVFLVNKGAHPPHEMQSIANMFNSFVQ